MYHVRENGTDISPAQRNKNPVSVFFHRSETDAVTLGRNKDYVCVDKKSGGQQRKK